MKQNFQYSNNEENNLLNDLLRSDDDKCALLECIKKCPLMKALMEMATKEEAYRCGECKNNDLENLGIRGLDDSQNIKMKRISLSELD